MASSEDIFSPLNLDFDVAPDFSIEAGFQGPQKVLPPIYKEIEFQNLPWHDSIPRKPIPALGESYTHHYTNSFDTMQTDTMSDTSPMKEEAVTAKRGWRFYGTFGCLALLNLICAIDATILSVALPVCISSLTITTHLLTSSKTIATKLKGTTAIEAFWCGTSFLLCSTVFQPTWASFSHIIGRKSVLLTALALFTAGTIVCSVAGRIGVLLVGRCIQGVGGGGLVALTYVIVTDMVTLRERGKWMSVISLQWAIGSIIGPVIGGALAQWTTWRWIFWLNIPFCVIAAIGVPFCLRLNTKEGSVWTRLKSFDWFGSFLFVAATTSFLIPLTWVRKYPASCLGNIEC
jgi:MFS family permease